MELEIISIETDVLIIGGGLGGCMAAIKAAEHDIKVTVAEKANTNHSGAAGLGVDHTYAYIPEIHGKMGWTVEDMMEDYKQSWVFVNEDVLRLVSTTMYDRIMDLERFGVNFRYEDSKLPGKFRVVPQWHSVPTALNYDGREIKKRLTEEMKRRGVNIINRVMMTDLISTDGQISGAVGVGIRTGAIYFFKAKSVVMATGRSTRLSRHNTGIEFENRAPASLSGDGKAMAYRVGLDVLNMEFLLPPAVFVRGFHQTGGPSGGKSTWHPASDVIDHTGKVIYPRQYFYDWDKYFKEGIDAEESRRKWQKERSLHSPPVLTKEEFIKMGPLYGGCSADATDYEIEYIRWSNSNEGKCYQLLYHLDEEMNFNWKKDRLELGLGLRELWGPAGNGILVDKNLETKLKGLFAAGEDAGGMAWASATGAIAMGWYAGDMAAQRAENQTHFLPESKEKLEALKETCSEMLQSKEGFYWKEVELAVQNVMDLNCAELRTGPMLKRGIELLQEMRAAPIRAENPHELMRSMEVKSILDNCEMTIRLSLERKESRLNPFGFRRADYPEQDDSNWLCFSAIRQEDGECLCSKIPIR